MSSVRCYALYGLLGGPFPFGIYYSAGLDALSKRLSTISSEVEILPSFGWTEWRHIVRDIGNQSEKTRIVMYGHSMGANQLPLIASRAWPRKIDLIAAFDPTIWYPIPSVRENVKNLIWFRGISFLSIAGHGRMKVSKPFTGKFTRIDLGQRHEKIDDNKKAHDLIVTEVCKLLQPI